MKNLVIYLWLVLLLGSFTAVVGSIGNVDTLEFIVSYCFWGCMLAPMLGSTEKTYTGNEKRRQEGTGSN